MKCAASTASSTTSPQNRPAPSNGSNCRQGTRALGTIPWAITLKISYSPPFNFLQIIPKKELRRHRYRNHADFPGKKKPAGAGGLSSLFLVSRHCQELFFIEFY